MRSELAAMDSADISARPQPIDAPISPTKTAVAISVTQGKIAVQFSELASSLLSGDLIHKILEAVQNVDLKALESEAIAKGFFSDESVRPNRMTAGIVETPGYIARFIVSTAYQRWRALTPNTEQVQDAPQWLDPCSGAGAFTCEILRYYCDELGARQISELPYLTFAELSPIGLTFTLCNIKLELQKRELNFSEYVASGRLTFYCGDSLQLFPERSGLFEKGPLFDIIVGNPPYVRATRLTLQYKKQLRQYAPNVYSGDADLYTYFIASGITNLRPNGVLAYISPAAFSRAKSGQVLRRWLRGKAAVDTYLDLDETKVFAEAELHSAIYVLAKKTIQSSAVHYRRVGDASELLMLCDGSLAIKQAIFERESDGWSFHGSTAEYQEYASIFSGTQPIRNFGLTVYSGIRPGYSDAFIIDEKTYLKFSENVRNVWFKPTIMPANIIRWQGAKRLNFMLLIPAGTKTIDAEVLNYLLPFKKRLSLRVEARKSDEWFTLRPCSYYSTMNQRKIVFPDLSAKQRFALVGAGIFVPDGAYFIDSDDLVLLGILNSSIAKMYFINKCSSVGNLSAKGRFRFKKTFVQDFPVPPQYRENGPIQSEIRAIVDEIVTTGETPALMRQLDLLVTNLYKSAK